MLAAQIADAALRGVLLLSYEMDDVGDPSLFEPKALEYAKQQAAIKVTHILETTRDHVQEVIGQAIQEGWSLNKTADALTELYDGFETSRGLTIARTEIAAAINWGKYTAATEAAGRLHMTLQREWIAVRDGRTRATHAAVSGTVKKLGEAFSVGGYNAQFPGDPNLPAEESINCRCTLIWSEVEQPS